LDSLSVTPSAPEGWGVERNFTVTVTDDAADTVTVYLWEKAASGEWTQIGAPKNCNPCDGTILSWTYNYTCSNFSAESARNFKFNATDLDGNIKENSSAPGITLQKDNIQVDYISGNFSTATLFTPAEFVLRVNDTDIGGYVITNTLNMKFNITTDNDNNSVIDGSNMTQADGYIYYSFLPDGRYDAGTRYWFGFSESESCYYDNGSSEYVVIINVNWPPIYQNEKVNNLTSGAIAGWGTEWNFSVTIMDNENDDVNVTLQIYNGTEWNDIEKQECPECGSWTQKDFFTTFDCSFEPESVKYRFFIEDNMSNVNTTTEHSFDIAKEKVNVKYIYGNSSIANRSAGQTDLLIFRMQDENGTYLSDFGTKFYVTTDGSNPYSDETYTNTTNSTGYTHLSFNPSCLNDYSGAPKFMVDEQQWKVTVNDSELGCYQQNDSYDTIKTNLFVHGDIAPVLSKPRLHSDPTGDNFTQEENIDFLGYTVDDCGDSLTLNTTVESGEVKFYINQSPATGYNCTDDIELVGSNAYSCTMPTSITTDKGWYNATLYVNKSMYYNNFTLYSGDPGLFFMNAIQKLESPTGTPSAEGWGYTDWNFSIIASSGDPDVTYNVSVMLSQTPPPSETDKCEAPTCINQTVTDCKYPDCVDRLTYWYRNFTASDIGTWYYGITGIL